MAPDLVYEMTMKITQALQDQIHASVVQAVERKMFEEHIEMVTDAHPGWFRV